MINKIIKFSLVVIFILICLIFIFNIFSPKTLNNDITSFSVPTDDKYYIYKGSYYGPKYGSDPRYDYIYEVDVDGKVKKHKYDDQDFTELTMYSSQTKLNEYDGLDLNSTTSNWLYNFNITNKVVSKNTVTPEATLTSVGDSFVKQTSVANADGTSYLELIYLDNELNQIGTLKLENENDGALFVFDNTIYFVPSYSDKIYEITATENSLQVNKTLDSGYEIGSIFGIHNMSSNISILDISDVNDYSYKSILLEYKDGSLNMSEIVFDDVSEDNFILIGNKYDENNVIFYEYDKSNFVVEKIIDYNLVEKKVNRVVEIKNEKIHAPTFIFN